MQFLQKLNPTRYFRGLWEGRRYERTLEKAIKSYIPRLGTHQQIKGVDRRSIITFHMMRQAYKRSEVVRACVDTIIEEVCNADWSIEAIDGDANSREEKQAIEELTTLFKRPNKYEAWKHFIRKLLRSLIVLDAAGIEIEATRGGEIANLYVVDGGSLKIDCDPHGVHQGYWQNALQQNEVYFDFENLIYLMAHPQPDDVYGLSILETAIFTVVTDLYISNFNTKFFEKNGVPPGILSIANDMGMSEEEWVRIQSHIENQMSLNPHNLIVIPGQDVKYAPIRVSKKDMDFIEYQKQVEKRIYKLFRVTPSEMGETREMGGLGARTAETQSEVMEEKGVLPWLGIIEDYFNLRIVSRYSEKIQFKFTQDNTYEKDKEWKELMQALPLGVVTINEVRKARGLGKPVEWGDVPFSGLKNWLSPEEQQKQQEQQMQMQQNQMTEQHAREDEQGEKEHDRAKELMQFKAQTQQKNPFQKSLTAGESPGSMMMREHWAGDEELENKYIDKSKKTLKNIHEALKKVYGLPDEGTDAIKEE